MNQHAPIQAETEQSVVPFYEGTRYTVDEIILGMNVATAKVRDLKGSHDARTAVALKIAADDLAKVASQISTLATHLAKVTTEHVNRRPRV